MSSTKTEAKITMSFEDDTTRIYTLPDVPTSITAESIEAAVIAINDGTAPNVADFRKTFVSTAGESYASIIGAKLITTTEDVIYSG